MSEPNNIEPKLAAAQLTAYGEGVSAHRAGKALTSNPYRDDILKASLEREWREGWAWSRRHEPTT